MLVWSKFITWSYWALILFHIDPNQERWFFFASERNYQIHGKLQPILNLSYFSKRQTLRPIQPQKATKFRGEKYVPLFHGNHLSPAGSVNLIPPQTDYGITMEFSLKSRVVLGTLSQQEPPGPLCSSQQLLVCYLAPWHDQTPSPALAVTCVSSGWKFGRMPWNKDSSELTPKTRWRTEKHLWNIYISIYFSGG